MKNDVFIRKLKEISNLPTTYYSVAGGDWAKWNGNSWNFDCVILVKAILWGWNADKNASHGGAVYASNGVYDDNADQIINRCTDVSSDFSNIIAGELLWMNGHVGIYIGNGQVIECTAAWESKVVYSDIDSTGKRSRNGKQVGSWKKHGKLPYIEYVVQTSTSVSNSKNVNVFYRVKTEKHGWLPEVKNLTDYAGWENSPITGLAIRVDKGSIKYRVHLKGKGWLPYVTGFNINDFNSGFAGDGKNIIDAVEVYYYTPNDIRPFKKAKYKINDYPYQYDNEKKNGQDGYAGVYGVTATKFQIIIE